ncbi:pentapeptide repeat-containing protein [Methylococcus sp. EFPC2]|uniref:pentapeptide repeat-containing protein n=1 Tax=Methylococcus sp. EFPC2 TaxID=2812648 RepID=UPI001968109B|nr:pentapeptide repeat-containing protein [Methylococcus sp. EFPC2]QSA96670.1 pentapeptide repeat-containing protein [Methylococcus sp. EFPC2]
MKALVRGVTCGLVVACCSRVSLADAPGKLSVEQAYLEIGRSGELRDIQIDGNIDLARLQPPAGVTRIILQGVQVSGKLHVSGDGPKAALWIDHATLQSIDLSHGHLQSSLEIENSTVDGVARFEGARFDGPFALHSCVFNNKAVFRKAHFSGPVEIVASQFHEPAGLKGGVSFSDTRFAAPARFDRSHYYTDLRFDTSRFDADAAFLRLTVDGHASWRNVIFADDAEFRFCRLGEADFGDDEQMSVFKHMADFRGCVMRSIRLDYAEIAGDALLVDMRVSPGNLSLRQASLRGDRTDFKGLQVAGLIYLQQAYIPNLHFLWVEIRDALLRGSPSSDVLRSLKHRLEALGDEDGAREVGAALESHVIEEKLARMDVALSDRLTLWLEKAVWGWPTGYGTRLDRILGLALASWLSLSLPLAFGRGLRVARLRNDADLAMPRHSPAPRDALMKSTPSTIGRYLASYAYGFGLMFAMPNLRLRPTEPLPAFMGFYLVFLRLLGAVLLALTGLTLAKVSPIIQALLGKIVH